jgi:anti-anti-sigma factor
MCLHLVIRLVENGKVLVIEIIGDADERLASLDHLKTSFLVDHSCHSIVLNCAGMHRLDNDGAAHLFGLLQILRAVGKRIVIGPLHAKAAKKITTLGLHQIFPVRKTEAEAITAALSS